MTTRSRAPKIKKTKHLTLRDRLSRLNYLTACKLLGPEGDKLIQQGSKYDIDVQRNVYLRGDLYQRQVRRHHGREGRGLDHQDGRGHQPPQVQLHRLRDDVPPRRRGRLAGAGRQDRAGASHTARRKAPLELLSEEELIEHALRERQKRAKDEKFRITSQDSSKPWTDYTVASALSGKTYRVALRGEERGQSYCSCPDFKTNTLGTCKHILHLLEKVRRRFPAAERAQALPQSRDVRPRALRRGDDAPPPTARQAG